MSNQKHESPCDCLNDCGDDPWLKDGSGRAVPCPNLRAYQEEKCKVAAELAKIAELRNTYGAANLYDLLDKLHAEVIRLRGEAKVMRDLLNSSLTVLHTIDEEDDHERALLKEFKGKIAAVIEMQLVRP